MRGKSPTGHLAPRPERDRQTSRHLTRPVFFAEGRAYFFAWHTARKKIRPVPDEEDGPSGKTI
jgi:hypothetical protein